MGLTDAKVLDLVAKQVATFEGAYAAFRDAMSREREDGPPLEERSRLLQALDAVSEQLRLHGGSGSALPSREDFRGQLDTARMTRHREAVRAARRPADEALEALAFMLTAPRVLKALDCLPPTRRLTWYADLLERAPRLQAIEAERATRVVRNDPTYRGPVISSAARVRRIVLLPRDPDPAPLLFAEIGAQHVFAPDRFRKLADDLQVVLLDDGTTARVELSRGPRSATKLVDEARSSFGLPTGTAPAKVAEKVAAQYGNVVTLVSPLLGAAKERAEANKTLAVAMRWLDPDLEETTSPPDVMARVDVRRAEVDRLSDAGVLARIGMPISAVLGVIGAYRAIVTASQAPFSRTSLREAAVALLQATDAVRAALSFVGRGSVKALARLGIATTIGMVILDAMAARASITDAARYEDWSVVAGEVLKVVGGAALGAAGIAGAVNVIAGASVVAGPIGLVFAAGFALALVGDWLVTFSRATQLKNLATVCAFGTTPASSTDPAKVEYGFEDGGVWQAGVQVGRLRSILQPLGFEAVPSSPGIVALRHRRPTAAGPAGQRLPSDASFGVSRVFPDGTLDLWGDDPDEQGFADTFDVHEFATTGESTDSAIGVQHRNGWLEMRVVMPDNSELLEYARLP